MKKILVVVVGLVLSAGLYAGTNCKKVDNFLTTLSGQRYVLNGNLCMSKGTSTNTIEQYIIDNANGKYGTVTNVSLTINGKTALLNGYLKVEEAPKVVPEGQTLVEFLKDMLNQLWNNPASPQRTAQERFGDK